MKNTILSMFFMGMLFSIAFSQGLNPENTMETTGISEENLRQIRNSVHESELTQIQTRAQERIQEITNNENSLIQQRKSERVQAHVNGLLETVQIEGNSNMNQLGQNIAESVNLMNQAEKKVQQKSAFSRFLFGTDRAAVNEMEKNLNLTRERIQTMEYELNSTEDPAIREMIQIQLNSMKTELEAVQTKVQTERKVKGLFGFLIRD